MKRLVPLSGGLVTSRDPAALTEGELSALQNSVYLPGAQDLVRAAGRTQFGPVVEGATVVSVYQPTACIQDGDSPQTVWGAYTFGGFASGIDFVTNVTADDGDATEVQVSNALEGVYNLIYAMPTLATGISYGLTFVAKQNATYTPSIAGTATFEVHLTRADGVSDRIFGPMQMQTVTATSSFQTYTTACAFPGLGANGPANRLRLSFNTGANTSYSPNWMVTYIKLDATSSVTAGDVDLFGLRDLKFDNSDHFLLVAGASASTTYFSTAVVADTGVFASATSATGTGSTAIDAIHYLDEWYVLGGGFRNLTFYVSATSAGQVVQTRPHGLNPVITQVGASATAGTWTAGELGYYEYWNTEVFEYVRNGATAELESTYAAVEGPKTVQITSTAVQLIIQPGTPQANPQAQKWRLYRAGPKDLATDTLFPAGFQVDGDFVFASATSIIDGGATIGTAFSATTTALDLSSAPLNSWATPTNAFTSNDAYATHTGATNGSLILGFADFAGINDPVLGLELIVEGRKNANTALCSVAVSNDGGFTYGTGKTVLLQNSAGDGVVTIGAGNDKWGLNWSAAGTTSTKFRVRFVGSTPIGSLFIDHVQARFTYSGTNVGDSEIPFPAVIVEIDGTDASVGSHGLPPRSTTGDIFQGSLVLNNVDTPANTYHSLPGAPDYFPSIYFIDFETPDNDRVTNIKTLNNRLGVFLATRLFRVNYLPTEADANFSRGICKEEVSSELGCVNAMCAVQYTGPTGRTEIAFVSNVGIHSTDLFIVRDLSTDLDWREMFTAASATALALINDPEHSELLFYYRNDALAPESYKCLHLSYDGVHIKKGGALKLSGQVHMRNYASAASVYADLRTAWPVQRTSGLTSIYLGYGASATSATAAGAGYVYRETGSNIPALDPTMDYTTRRMFLAGFGSEWRLSDLYSYINVGITSGTQGWTCTPYTVKTNASAGLVAQAAKQLTWNGEVLYKHNFNLGIEGGQFRFSQASASAQNPWAIGHLVLDVEGAGDEDSKL